MRYSNKTRDFTLSVINAYSIYDTSSETYDIYIDDIEEDDLYKLCSLIMLDDPEAAFESISIENPLYAKSMMPSLQVSMYRSNYAFVDEWQKGILSYFRNRIIQLLEDSLEIYNEEMAA